MYRNNRFFFTITQFLLLIDNTKQLKTKQTSIAFKAIGNTIKKPLIKTIGSTIKKSMNMFHENRNNIKNLAFCLQENCLRTSHNVGQMGGKELGSLINMVSKSKPQVPFLFAGGLTKLAKFNVMSGNNFDDKQHDISNSTNEIQKISLEFLKNEILRVDAIKPTSVVQFTTVKKVKCKSSIKNFNFTLIHVDGLKQKSNETKFRIMPKISPFVPPLDEGIYISKINDTHILLFNKFSVVKSHLQIATANYVVQDMLQTKEDFTASYRALLANQHENTFKSVVYFNSGRNSGSTQKHRHLQAFTLNEENPCTAMYKVIDAEVKKNMGESSGYTTFSGFKGYKHLIYKFPKIDNSNMKDLDMLDKFVKAEVWEKGYVNLMKKFEIFDGLDYDSLGKFSYNMVMNDNWVMVCLRGSQFAAGGKFAQNACGLMGGLLVKDQESQQALSEFDTKTIMDELFIKEM